MTVDRVVVGLLILAVTGSTTLLSIFALFAFRKFGLEFVTARLLVLVHRPASFNIVAAVIRKVTATFGPIGWTAHRQWFIKVPSVTSTLVNLMILVRPIAICAFYGLLCGWFPAALFCGMAGSLKDGTGDLDPIMWQAAPTIMAVLGALIGASECLYLLLRFKRAPDSVALRQLVRRTPKLDHRHLVHAYYNMSAYSLAGWQAVCSVLLWFNFVLSVSTGRSSANAYVVAPYDVVAVVVAIALGVAVVTLFRRRMGASAALVAIMGYRAVRDQSYPATSGVLSPITDPPGGRRALLLEVAAVLERSARTFDDRFKRPGPPLVATLLRAVCRDIRRTVHSKRTFETDGFDDLHSVLDSLAACLAAPGDLESAAALCAQLDIFGADGQPDSTLADNEPGRLVALSQRVGALAEHIEHPARLVKALVFLVAVVGLAKAAAVGLPLWALVLKSLGHGDIN